MYALKREQILITNNYSLYHTDRFLVEMFHNYAFKECISVENLKLWLLILTKTLFLMTILIKLTTLQYAIGWHWSPTSEMVGKLVKFH